MRNRHLVGLIGADIGPSLTPPLHEREADALGPRVRLRAHRHRRARPRARAGRRAARAAGDLGYAGLNITHPCKQIAVEHLDDLSPDAEALGAINTVVFADGRATGHNTDLPAFQRNFARGLPDVATRRVVLLGAGGAGAAVAHAALGLGVGGSSSSTRVPSRPRRSPRRCASASARPRRRRRPGCARRGARRRRRPRSTPPRSAWRAIRAARSRRTLLQPELWVADVVYRPLETELLRDARERGCRTLDGGGMAVFQAALSFALFTGIEPDGDECCATSAS